MSKDNKFDYKTILKFVIGYLFAEFIFDVIKLHKFSLFQPLNYFPISFLKVSTHKLSYIVWELL
jgi:hypothetical protein